MNLHRLAHKLYQHQHPMPRNKNHGELQRYLLFRHGSNYLKSMLWGPNHVHHAKIKATVRKQKLDSTYTECLLRVVCRQPSAEEHLRDLHIR